MDTLGADGRVVRVEALKWRRREGGVDRGEAREFIDVLRND